jgi:FkbM family methyltransferase
MTNMIPASLKQKLFLKVPTNLERLYRACRAYADRHEGELNGDMDTNGEMWIGRQLATTSRIVFDVGANQGQWARRMLDYSPDLQLHAFEPSRTTFSLLKGNVPRAICNNFGLSNQAHSATLYSFGPGHGWNSLHRRTDTEHGDPNLKQNQTEQVRLETIDNYCAEKEIGAIDFLKIDIEGHDLEAIRGAERMIREHRIAVIQFEYGNCNLDSGFQLKDFFGFFPTHGYRLAKLLPDALRPVDVYTRSLETFRYQNWVAFPRDAAPNVTLRS